MVEPGHTAPEWTATVLVTGATGYVGGRLVPRLLEAGYRVRAVGRSLEKLQARPWARHPACETVALDLQDRVALTRACQGCRAAYYLVHSMNPESPDYAEADRRAARNLVASAAAANLERIVYLGGLGEEGPSLSRHLRSRHEVGEILMDGVVPVTILRAAMIIGSGSASFEILRYLVDRLPVIITPRWVHTPFQPIAIRNVLTYLVRCLEEPGTLGQMLDIGGPEILTYRDMMRMYAEEAGLARRWIIPVPVLTPRLSSYWIHVVTPVPAAIARPLAEGLANPVICRETRIRTLIPLDLLTPREAVRRALSLVRQGRPETHWTDAGLLPGDPEWAGGTLLRDDRRLMVHASQEQVWRAIAGIGGERGWYQLDWIWTVRGVLDRFMGGVGLRRGRRHPDELAPGDALDFWRVLEVEPGRRLRLGAEMRLPGIATLQWRLQEQTPGEVLVVQQVRFRPRGLAGILYWYAVSPLHGIVFQGLLRGIARQASRA